MGILNRLLDKSIVFSFDRSGFERHREKFDDPELNVDMTGKVALVTGANSGLGYATSRALGRRGATVHLLCRNEERGTKAANDLRKETGSDRVALDLIDVSDLESVRQFAKNFGSEQVDVLVHNAGVLLDTRSETADGLETTWATNVVGQFLLTVLLRDRLEAAPQGRVIVVTSGGMYTTKFSLSDRNWTRRDFDGVQAYAETKRAEVVLTEQWADVFRNSKVTINAMHPGWADTPSVKTSIPKFHKLLERRLRTWEQGADTIVWLAVEPSIAQISGKLFFDRNEAPMHMMSKTKSSKEKRDALWTRVEEDAGVEIKR